MEHGSWNMGKETFHEQLKKKMDEYVHLAYAFTRTFPREEQYGIISQLRRAALSVILNYIEGYARVSKRVHKNFLEISYGSLQESKYLLDFSQKENYLKRDDQQKIIRLADEIGAMLWGTISNLKE